MLSFSDRGIFFSPLRTIAYIDGFNLYFGCLTRAKHCKWLDLQALAQRLIHEHDPDSEITQVKYFTAPIKAGLSHYGEASCIAQQDYLLSLKAHCPLIEIIEGEFYIVPGRYHANQHPVNFNERLDVLRPEEKQTDVNIALHMLCDATDGLCEQQVLFSNDSDCAPVLKTVHARHPDMKLGVIAPILEVTPQRHPSTELSKSCNWTRKSIKQQELEDCQLPEYVLTRKRKITKPSHWK